MPRKKIAAIVTTFFPGSHADLLVSRFVNGFPTPSGVIESEVDVVSMYMDQLHPLDVGVELAREHGIELFPSIRSALTLRQPMHGHWPTAPGWEIGELAVDGVIIIAEHGDYSPNERGRQMYPRRHFFEQVCGMIGLSGRAIPGLQRQAPRVLVGRRALDVRPRRRAWHPIHGRIVPAGHRAHAVVRAQDRRRDRRRAGIGPLQPLSERTRLLRLPRVGGPPVHGRAAARRRDGNRGRPVH